MAEEEEKTEEKPEEKQPEEKKPAEPTPRSTPEEKKPEIPKEKKPEKVPVPKKKGGWFQKIPTDILLSPGGMVLIFVAGFLEILDWIPLPVLDQLWELPLEIIFMVLLVAIVKDISWKALVIPFGLERIAGFSDIFPTWIVWFLRMFF